MRMVVNPERFDVIVTTNMFGDIITDLGAVLQGGMGLAASGNLNPERALPEHVRAGAWVGARHRRQGGGQSAGRDPVGGDDARSPRPAAWGGADPRCGAARCSRQLARALPTWGAIPGPPTSAALSATQCWPDSRGLAVATKVSYNRTVVVLELLERRSAAALRMPGIVARKASKPDDKSESDRVL